MVLRASLEKKEEKERVRSSLLRAALALSAAHGFASLGLREVAREAGIAPTSFYRHFADMEELGAALIAELAGPVLRGLCERASSAPRDGLAGALLEPALSALADDPELMRFVLAERVGAHANLRAALREQQAQLARALHLASGAPPWACDAAVCVLLDACGKALDDASSPRDAALRAIQQLLAAAPEAS
ncbi:MAG TPA: TetR family transcriptional regulator [Polyangiales bacterium]|nr:TetR family transcriptional regulator [Polyangiales bacterium]